MPQGCYLMISSGSCFLNIWKWMPMKPVWNLVLVFWCIAGKPASLDGWEGGYWKGSAFHSFGPNRGGRCQCGLGRMGCAWGVARAQLAETGNFKINTKFSFHRGFSQKGKYCVAWNHSFSLVFVTVTNYSSKRWPKRVYHHVGVGE